MVDETTADVGNKKSMLIKNFDNIWFYPENSTLDIAITPIADLLNSTSDNNHRYFFRTIEQSIIPSSEQLLKFDALENIVFIGYPNGLWDSVNNLPIIRTGTSASPVYIDYENEPLFLIDASVFPGSSGSPVFIYQRGVLFDKKGNISTANNIYFLGVLSAVYNASETIPLDFINKSVTPVLNIHEKIDIGVVYKSSVVLDLVHSFLDEMKLLN